MTPELTENNFLLDLIELLKRDGSSGFRELAETMYNLALVSEREEALKASPYERTEHRQGYANGFKPRKLMTNVGELNLQMPQVRDMEFYPSSLEKGCRSEQALNIALAEMYIHGVSTRKVAEITKEIWGWDVSSSKVSSASKELDVVISEFKNRELTKEYPVLIVDATYFKIRECGIVQDMAILIAIGVDSDGYREVLGFSAELSEAEVHWRSFFESLQKRGLKGVKLLVSDAHSGLKAAKKTVFPSIPWQRCLFHLAQNAQAYISKRSNKSTVARDIKSIFNQNSLEEAEEKLKFVCSKYTKTEPRLVEWMEDNIRESFTYLRVFPNKSHIWKKVRTSNGLERLNQEVKRRTKIARIFPNKESAERLVGAVLMEFNDSWISNKKYINWNKSDDDLE